jgi:uncharacterized OB-fold protein
MILPSPSEHTQAYWQAALNGVLLLRHCDACDTWHHPRQIVCTCGSNMTWRPAAGKGSLMSFTVVHLGLNPELASQVPYTITLTKLSEGPHILTAIPNRDEQLRCGMDMKVTFDRVTPSVVLPRFVPAQQ